MAIPPSIKSSWEFKANGALEMEQIYNDAEAAYQASLSD